VGKTGRVKARLWGTRGSIASPGPETTRYGGNTSCVEVTGPGGSMLILDAGTGLRRLGYEMPRDIRRVDILLTHLHMDHIQGLAFFTPLRQRGIEAHIWGPPSSGFSLRARLTRYISPPLFPLYLRDIRSDLNLHEAPTGSFQVGAFRVTAALVIHPDPTVGFRVECGDTSLTYLPDHEPALGMPDFPAGPAWTSGHDLAQGADLLIHDAQYTNEEYRERVGYGHSTIEQTVQFAAQAGVKRLVPFHHDPAHTDADLDRYFGEALDQLQPDFAVTPGIEGAEFSL
jgi:ribonuclease BN (tRNA processing enzyme)